MLGQGRLGSGGHTPRFSLFTCDLLDAYSSPPLLPATISVPFTLCSLSSSRGPSSSIFPHLFVHALGVMGEAKHAYGL